MLRLLASVLPLLAALPALGSEGALRLSSLPEPAALAALLWEHAPALQSSRVDLANAVAAVDHAELLPNPSLDLSMSPLPIGPTNPPHLPHPWSSIPSYSAEVSTLVELGKRGARQESARGSLAATREEVRATLFDAFFGLSESMGRIAAAEVRIASLSSLADDARTLTGIQKARAGKGDVASLDVERSEIEEEQLWANLETERAKLAEELRTCLQLSGLPCEPFGSSAAAAAFLDRRGETIDRIENRPDLETLRRQAEAAQHSLRLAHAQAIPDPTLRLGYSWDPFTPGGGQENSFSFGVSFPLPFFDHGQADARLAKATERASLETRGKLLEQARTQLARVEQEQRNLEARRERLKTRTVPLARKVVDRLQEVVRRGGAPLQDLLLARRTLGELTLDAADMDLAAQQLDITAARIRGTGPEVPACLRGMEP